MTRTFTPSHPIWCAGCGHFGVRNALAGALRALDVPPHETMLLAGIGCSGTVQNNILAYGYHALHGRVLPTAIGVKLANPALTVVAAGGDGDGYAIGAGHLVHAFKRNASVLYVLMNNGIYGLTKGQRSPTAEPLNAGAEQGLDGVSLGLAIPGSTFIARGYSGAPQQLDAIMRAALGHVRQGKGFGFVEVMSPCVTYNDTYLDWSGRVGDVAEAGGHDPADRVAAFGTVHRMVAEGRIPTGIILDTTGPTFDGAWRERGCDNPAALDVSTKTHLATYSDIMQSYEF